MVPIFEKNYVKSEKNAVFCYFGGSAGFTEASAELFRPILTEASAEASVSVVHYTKEMIRRNFFGESTFFILPHCVCVTNTVLKNVNFSFTDFS